MFQKWEWMDVNYSENLEKGGLCRLETSEQNTSFQVKASFAIKRQYIKPFFSVVDPRNYLLHV